jgi:hypothetical protein
MVVRTSSQIFALRRQSLLSQWVTWLMVACVFGGVLLPLHHHEFSLSLQSDPALSSHNCETHGPHVPLNVRDLCLVCCQSVQHVSPALHQDPGAGPEAIVSPGPSHPCVHLQSSTLLVPDRRGPPFVA